MLGSTPVWAETMAPQALNERDRAITGARAVIVAVPKSEIEAEVDVGRVVSDAAYGGGLLGALINQSKDHKREELIKIDAAKADGDIAPLRQSMADFDFAAMAGESARSALSQVDWFHAQDIKSIKTPPESDLVALAKDAGTQQFATVTYHYSLSPDFTQIKVFADLVLLRPETIRKNEAPKPPTTLFQQRVIVIAQLQKRSYDHPQNVAQWSAGNGKLAKASITTALSRIEHLIPYALNLSPTVMDTLQKAKADKVFAAGFYGPAVTAIPLGSGETVLWKQGLIDVIDVPESSAVATR
jgi:hypothetical protein